MTTLTITRALREIETLADRIGKLNTTNANFEGYLVVAPSNLESTNRKEEVAKFLRDGDSQYQSVTTLIARRDKIKSLIILSNATNTVRIGDETLTVAEAIEKKKSIIYSKDLLNFMKAEQRSARYKLEQRIKEYETKLEAFIISSKEAKRAETGKDVDLEFVSKTTASYATTNYPKIYEPFNFSDEITNLEKYITAFEDDIDVVLSEANATNTIEIPD